MSNNNRTTITVKKKPIDTGPVGWQRILPPRVAFSCLEEDIDVDWAIVGGGFAGLAAAQRLKQLVGNERIVLIDACQLAQGPAGRNSGFMIDLPHELKSNSYAGSADEDRKQIQLNRLAINFAKQMAEKYALPTKVFNPCGKITAAASARGERHIDTYTEHLDHLNEQYQLLGSSELKSITGSDFYKKGIFTPGAVIIQPAAFIDAIAKGLSNGVEIYENTPALKVNLGDKHRLVTPNATINARHIILAVNGHVQSFGFYPLRLMHVFTYAAMTRALTEEELSTLGGDDDWGILPADPMGSTVRKISDYAGSGHRITVRNRFTLNQSMEISEQSLSPIAKKLNQTYAARFPELRQVPMEYVWGGRLCLSWNSVPAFGEVEDRIYSAACQNGLGTVRGTLSGMLAAEQATGHQSQHLTSYLGYDAPRLLPPQPFLSIGANVTMRWKEWLAGREL